MDPDALEHRLASLERSNRILTRMVSAFVLVTCAAVSAGVSQSGPSTQPLRARGLIIEDATGTPRVVIGAPIQDRNVGGNPRTGLIINDAAGVERLGLSLQQSGRMVMGFDAPPGKGDDRNRERITLVADENGGGYIRFLDRTTSIPARIYLDEQNRVWLEFIGTQANEIVRRRIGLAGDETIRSAR
jgi:hypothetical protein